MRLDLDLGFADLGVRIRRGGSGPQGRPAATFPKSRVGRRMERHESASYLGVSIRNPRPEPAGKLRATPELRPAGIVRTSRRMTT